MKEIDNAQIKDRLTKILNSLEKQQNELWNKNAFASVSGNDPLDFNTRTSRKHVMKWALDISKMRMLELLLKRLFYSTEHEYDEIIEDFDKFVRETANVYVNPF